MGMNINLPSFLHYITFNIPFTKNMKADQNGPRTKACPKAALNLAQGRVPSYAGTPLNELMRRPGKWRLSIHFRKCSPNFSEN
jgi:hypothetical protein